MDTSSETSTTDDSSPAVSATTRGIAIGLVACAALAACVFAPLPTMAFAALSAAFKYRGN